MSDYPFKGNNRSWYKTCLTPRFFLHFKCKNRLDISSKPSTSTYKYLNHEFTAILKKTIHRWTILWNLLCYLKKMLNILKSALSLTPLRLTPPCVNDPPRFLHMLISPQNWNHIQKYFSIKRVRIPKTWSKKSCDTVSLSLGFIHFNIRVV